MDDGKIYNWLRLAGLEEYYANFVNLGVTADVFLQFTMQDYGNLFILTTYCSVIILL